MKSQFSRQLLVVFLIYLDSIGRSKDKSALPKGENLL